METKTRDEGDKIAQLLRERAQRLQRGLVSPPRSPSPVKESIVASAAAVAVPVLEIGKDEIPGVPRTVACSEDRYKQVAECIKPLFGKFEHEELVRHAKLFVQTDSISLDKVREYLLFLQEESKMGKSGSFTNYGVYFKEKKKQEEERLERVKKLSSVLPYTRMSNQVRLQYENEVSVLASETIVPIEMISVYFATIVSDAMHAFISFKEFMDTQIPPSSFSSSSSSSSSTMMERTWMDEYREKQRKKFVESKPEGWILPNQQRQKKIRELFEKSIIKFGKQATDELRWFQRPEMETIPLEMIELYVQSLEDAHRTEREFWNYIEFKRDYEARKKKEEEKRRVAEKTKALLQERSREIKHGDRYIPIESRSIPRSEWPESYRDLYNVRIMGSEEHPIRQRPKTKKENLENPNGYRIDGKTPGLSPYRHSSNTRRYIRDSDSDSDSDSF